MEYHPTCHRQGHNLSQTVDDGSGVRPGAYPPEVAPQPTRPCHIDGLLDLAAIVAQRIRMSDKVLAAKLGASLPIDDAAREQQVIDRAVAVSRKVGLDPAIGTGFFRVQIEASKLLQRGLHALWSAHPGLAPAETPDLDRDVRPALDKLNDQLLHRVNVTITERRDKFCGCQIQRVVDVITASVADHWDSLHREALQVALAPIREWY
ncbi:gamma subclass chorismate mutase AroQ [Dactylosporangium sp. NPDC005572]|uniref:gamma subclass chorismate mutase AroQ n=1 Tax=Dactylosporangium sp. NPDC005572 TaxID=3156889 RepID=UPI0033B0431B